MPTSASTCRERRAGWLAAALVMLAVAPAFAGDQLAVKRRAALRARPGERSDVISYARPGMRVEVVARRGRWLKVKLEGRTGWLTRTQVKGQPRSAPADREEIVSSKRQSKAERRAAAKAKRAAARDTGNAADQDGPRGRTAGKRGGGWQLRDARAEGQQLDTEDPLGATRAARLAEATPAAPTAPLAVQAQRPASRFELTATVGLRQLGSDLSSDSQAGLGNTAMSAPAAATELGARYRRTVRRLELGVQAQVSAARGAPGIRYVGSSGESGDIAFSTLTATVGGSLGIALGGARGPLLAARAGYHHESFQVDDLDNVGLLPNERLNGLVIGGEIELPDLAEQLSARIGVDMLVGGRRSQTVGMEDGQQSRASAAWAGVELGYPLTGALSLAAAYRYGWAQTEWTGPSNRLGAMSEALRVDRSQSAVLGLALAY